MATNAEILEKCRAVAAGTLDPDAAAAELAVKREATLTLKASPKGLGNVCVYGLQTRPMSLYPLQWRRLLAISDDIRSFINENREILSFAKGVIGGPDPELIEGDESDES